MADYTDTVLQNARAFQNESLNEKFERRPNQTYMTDMFLNRREFTIPELDDIRKAATQTTQIMYEKVIDYTVNTSKSCSPSGEEGDSGIASVTWAQKSATTILRDKLHQGNEVKKTQAIATKLLDLERSIFLSATGLDAAMIAFLEANRTQVNAISGGGGHNNWDAADFQVNVANADLDRYYNYLVSEMTLNNYGGELMEAVNTLWMSDVNYLANQGEGNQVNTAFQFSAPNMINGYQSNLITPGAGEHSVHYVVPSGGVAMLDWNDPLNLRGEEIGDKVWTTWRSRLFPSILLDLYITKECADTTAKGGGPQDLVENWELTLNYALLQAPFSVSGESAIYKYVIAI